MPNKAGLIRQFRRWLSKQAIPLLIVAGAIALAVVMVNVSAERELSTLELILWQVVSLLLGLSGSYWFGRNAARDSARDVIRPHARSAVRSLLALRDSLRALSHRIEDYQDEDADYRLEVIQAIVEEQMPVSDSAIEDWRDITPEDVAEIIRWWENEEERGKYDYAN